MGKLKSIDKALLSVKILLIHALIKHHKGEQLLENFFAFSLQQLPFVIIALLVAFTVHEYAHAIVAYKFGDDTAKNQGRLTLSPLAHLDPLGTILILIAGFGWARPVPVDRRNFKQPRLAGILVSLAGPMSNLIIAFIAMTLLLVFQNVGWIDTSSTKGSEFLYTLFYYLVYLNVLLFVFNLLPLPPLDGYRVIEDLAPQHIRIHMQRLSVYGSLIFLIIVLTPLDQYTIRPIFQTVIPGIINGMRALLPF